MMTMKKITFILLTVLPLLSYAQQTSVQPLTVSGQAINQWDTEINLDTIDQEKLPRRVTGGIMATANISNFIIHQNNNYFSSYMKVGGDLGGFIDFTVTKHFAIQGRLVVTAEQNYFKDNEANNHLWSFGIDLPVLFLARFGNLEKGYLSFGGGPFTHFTLVSNIGDKYTHTEKSTQPKRFFAPREVNPSTEVVHTLPNADQLYTLHDNHSGLMASISYEFPIGIQIVANYLVSLTDIVTFYKQNKTADNVSGIYPQRIELGIAYRWRTKAERK